MSVSLPPGTEFARDYVVERPLSEGGMGAVYVVAQRSTGKMRALKVMHPQLMHDPGLRGRFEREARVGARIESEHVVEVLAAGIDDATSMPWLVMELLEGETLADHVQRRGPLPPSEARVWLEQLCHAVGAAHALTPAVVHRDLKPENLFLARSRAVGAPFKLKVLDFGIATIASEAKTSATAAIGTPLWMAPEQAKRGNSITPTTDVWAIGLVAYFLLTARLYWLSAYDPNCNPAMILTELLTEPIEPPSQRARAAGLTVSMPPGFDEWFARCVDRDPSKRHRDARAAWQALAPVLGGDAPVRTDTVIAPTVGPSPSVMGSTVVEHPSTVFEPARTLPAARGTTEPIERPPTAPDGQPARGAAASRRPAAGILLLGVVGVVAAALMLRVRGTHEDARRQLAEARATSEAETFDDDALRKASAALDAAKKTWPEVEGAAEIDAKIAARRKSLDAAAHAAALLDDPDGWRTAKADIEAAKAEPGNPRVAELEKRWATLAAQESTLGKTMVRIPGGTFTMGSSIADYARPAHSVTVSSFWLDRYEVTVEQYAKCVEAKRCVAQATVLLANFTEADAKLYEPHCNYGKSDRQSHPMNCVDWNQADAYCRFVERRLPTEAEWEYAARGGSAQRTYPWGEEEPGPTRLNVCDADCTKMAANTGWTNWKPFYTLHDGFALTAPVGSFDSGKSLHGVHDLDGNVREWTSSCYAAPYDGHELAACTSGSTHAFRGGSWDDYNTSNVRNDYRGSDNATARSTGVGFRCAL